MLALMTLLAAPVVASPGPSTPDAQSLDPECKPGKYYYIAAGGGANGGSVELLCGGVLVDSCSFQSGEDGCSAEGFYWGLPAYWSCEGSGRGRLCFTAYHLWEMLDAGPEYLPL